MNDVGVSRHVECTSLFSMGRESKKAYLKKFHDSDWLVLSKLYDIKTWKMSLCIGQNIDQHSFKFANLRKEVQI